jgi:hypothetical protein
MKDGGFYPASMTEKGWMPKTKNPRACWAD